MRSSARSERGGEGRPGLWFAVAMVVLVAAYAGVLVYQRPHVDGERLRYDTFVRLVGQDRIRDARILNQDAYVVGTFRRRDGSRGRYAAPFLKVAGTQNALIELLLARRVPTTIDQQFAKGLVTPATILLPSLMLVAVFLYMILAYRRGTGLFAVRSGAARTRPEQPGSTFADVAGQDEAIAELRELADFLADAERFAALGARIPRGILLHGPPGCGKTLLARALAGEAGAAFLHISGSAFVQLYVGVGAARVRELFREARESAPAIVFIDEIDAIGGHRADARVDGHGEREQALNQILIELDGFEPRAGVIVMAATNRPDILDPALVRPGRFDRQVTIGLPDRAGREAILAVHASGKRLGPDVDLARVARLTRGFSGADLAGVLNEAALLAARRRHDQIGMPVVEEAIERVVLGISSHRRLLGEEERRIVAYHEAGHALAAATLPGGRVPHKVSIVARGDALGYAWMIDEDERVVRGRSALVDEMVVGLAGRAAEELVFGEPSSGAVDDLAKVSAIARWMVCELGMSERVGGVFYGVTDQHRPPASDEELRTIAAEVRRLVEEAQQRAAGLLAERRASLDALASALLDRETLSADDVLAVAAAPPPLRGAVA